MFEFSSSLGMPMCPTPNPLAVQSDDGISSLILNALFEMGLTDSRESNPSKFRTIRFSRGKLNFSL